MEFCLHKKNVRGLWINKILKPCTKVFQEDLKEKKELPPLICKVSKKARTVKYMQPKILGQFYDSTGDKKNCQMLVKFLKGWSLEHLLQNTLRKKDNVVI